MQLQQAQEINIDSLGVLKLEDKTGLVVVDYEPIPKLLNSEFEGLTEQLKLEHTNLLEVLDTIKNDENLKVLLKHYSYCKEFKSPYQGLSSITELEDKYKKRHQNWVQTKDKNTKLKDKLLIELTDRLQAYRLENAYKVCLEKLKEKQVLAYSHRRVGWSNKPYQLSPDFMIHIKTNFGYGSVSYFYVRLQFKGIDIIAFHDWVLYQDARCYEIVKYTRSFELANESWLTALEYTRDACNLSMLDEQSFIDKYIIEECERLVSGLEKILLVDEFELFNWNQKLIAIKMGSHKLIEFRGQKLSGALSFIDKILQFGTVADISGFVSRIEACNKQIQPIIEQEIPLVEKELNKLNEYFLILAPQYEDLKSQKESFDFKWNKFKEFMIEIGEFSAQTFDYKVLLQRFHTLFPNYGDTIQTYNQKHNEYHALTRQIDSFKAIKENLEECSIRIEEYFSKNLIENNQA